MYLRIDSNQFYYLQAMLVHPDKNMGSPLASESFKKLQCAYEVFNYCICNFLVDISSVLCEILLMWHVVWWFWFFLLLTMGFKLAGSFWLDKEERLWWAIKKGRIQDQECLSEVLWCFTAGNLLHFLNKIHMCFFNYFQTPEYFCLKFISAWNSWKRKIKRTCVFKMDEKF